MTIPPAVDLAALRGALDSPSPARAVITALLAYHAIPMRQLARLQLTDIRSGRLHRPVTSAWIGQQLAISAEHIRLDRIYQEVEATGGDIRALCDPFGMSIANAARWATTIDHITEPAAVGSDDDLPRDH